MRGSTALQEAGSSTTGTSRFCGAIGREDGCSVQVVSGFSLTRSFVLQVRLSSVSKVCQPLAQTRGPYPYPVFEDDVT